MRWRCMIALLLWGGCAALSSARAEEAPAAADRGEQLLLQRDADGMERPIDTVEAWAARRAEILQRMQAVMGPLPQRREPLALDVRVEETTERDGVTIASLSFAVEPGDRLPALLLTPPADALLPGETAPRVRRPAIVALHPTSPLGKRVVIGDGPRENRAYGMELAQRGYVVLCPDYPSFGDYAYDFAADDYVSGTMKGIVNHRRCVDFLCAREDVDPARIGAIGHSLGGHNALFLGAFDPRVQAVASSCGWTPFRDYYGGRLAGWASDRYMPRIRTEYALDPQRVPFDFVEVIAALAPRAFFSCSPLQDDNFDVRGVQRAMPQAARVYALFDAVDRLQLRCPDAEHDFPEATRREAYAFLDRMLLSAEPPAPALP